MLNEEDDAQFINPAGTPEPLANSEKYKMICALLNANPIMVQPTLKFIQYKLGQMAAAQLSTLYTPEEIEEMSKNAS